MTIGVALAGVCLHFLGVPPPSTDAVRSARLATDRCGRVLETRPGICRHVSCGRVRIYRLATVIYNAQPLLAAVLAHAVFGERLKALGKVGLVAGFAGIIAIAWRGLASGNVNGYTLGVACIFLAVTGEAVSNVGLKRLPKESDAMMVMGVQLLLGAAPLGLLSVWTENVSTLTWSADFVGILVVLSVLGTALPYWLWFAALCGETARFHAVFH